ncbi:uncharacterized protein A1O5_03658 [Cladophialophora psammophila CBS 110553]|uniref:Uncharacterized protein n=1 Tax=Cladophialophora psammophila CBS 110553 TaxID=1182543 RepID=W9XAH6_9EURO|nr:uncharacterized protein A1O5_03658 [Cladophialophora psammophila CBS 110553]EXJ73896.1 hypothetical protein A1O5_03658 [Cladophialophora psammophila CBS 110553]
MVFFIIFLAIVTYLVFGTEAFKVSFYKNINYAEEFVRAWIGGEGQGCRQKYAGLAKGVVIESTGPVDDSTTVQFYSSEDCAPETKISRADAGCLTIDQDVIGAYKSF